MNDDHEIRKLLLKQGEYRKLYSSILQKHRGSLQGNSGNGDAIRGNDSDGHFEDEARLLNQIFQTEVKNLATGIGATAATLASLRFARSRRAVSAVFGSAKAKVLYEAEIEGKRVGTDNFQKGFGTYHTPSH